MQVYFIDTTILCNLLPVPGRDQHRTEVLAEMGTRTTAAKFVLPMTTVIETGNFISKLSDGRVRLQTGQRFQELLELVCAGEAPWVLHDLSWGEQFLRRFSGGADTGMDLAHLAESGLGAGDLCVLTEVAVYRERTKLADVTVWTRDNQLMAFGS